jgi:intracellular septation protein
MKLLFDFLPILFFFIAYFLFDIYIATMVAIATSGLQVLSYWLKFRRVETMQLITFATISILGGATIFFHNPLFFSNKPFLQRLMDSKVNLPHAVWQKLNLSWAAFFIILGFANLYVAYHYSTNVWVYFKLIGALGATLIFALAQSIYMMRYLKDDNDSKPSSATGRL